MTISVDGLYLNGFSPQLNVLLSRNSLFIVKKKKNIMTIRIIMSMVMMTSQKIISYSVHFEGKVF